MSSSTEVDVGSPRRPFSELSAKLLYMALKDVEEAMNYVELTMVHMCQQIPRKSLEERLSKGVVKELLVRTEVDLKMAKRWLVARNLMATWGDPDCLDIQDHDVATEMIVESSRVINRVTELAERWQALASEPFEVDLKIVQWIIQVTKVKTELRMMLSMFKAAESIRRGEKDPLQWILEEVQGSKMEKWWKETMTPKSLILVEK